MAKKYLDDIGLSHFFDKLKLLFATKDTATQSSDGLMSSSDKAKLDSIDKLVDSASGTTVTVGETSGFESVTVYGKSGEIVGGANYLDKTKVAATSTTTVVQLENGIRVYTKSNGSNRNANMLVSELGLVSGRTYTITATFAITSGIARVAIRNSSNSIVDSTGNQTTDGKYSFTITYDPSSHYRLAFFVTSSASSAGDVTFTDIMINEGSVELPYVPYGYIGINVDGNLAASIDLNGNTLETSGNVRDFLLIDSVGHVTIDKQASSQGIVDLGFIDTPVIEQSSQVSVSASTTLDISVGWWTAIALPISRAFKSINSSML